VSKAPIAEAIERVIRAYRASLPLPNAQAIDYSRDVVSHGKGGHGKHGTTTTRPTFGADAPLPVQIERMVERMARVIEARLEDELEGAQPNAARAKTGKARREEDRAILAAVGEDPTALAFVYGRATEAVRKLRQRSGRDPDTGERVPTPRPITAPAREVAAAEREAARLARLHRSEVESFEDWQRTSPESTTTTEGA
jgi:hypothetical protein